MPESVTLEPGPEKEKAPESDKGEDSNPEENPVMNFFKTLVSDMICVAYMHLIFLIACKIRLHGKINFIKNLL